MSNAVDIVNAFNKTTNEKHVSGAIRSGDAMGVDYWLITPIGLRRLIEAYDKYGSSNYSEQDRVNTIYNCIFEYLSGSREFDYLAKAAMHISELIYLCDPHDNYRYRGIPLIVLRRLAETYNEGKIKYSEYNCELGLPFNSTLNHAVKHVTDHFIGDSKETTDLPHALWNVLMTIHCEEMTPEINTLMRGPGCTLTEPIRKYVKETMEKKYGQQPDSRVGIDASQRESSMCRVSRDDGTLARIP